MHENVGRRRSVAMKEEILQKELPFLGTIDGTDTVVRVEITSTPLTFRLQRCIDAVQSSDRTRRFSDESVFVIDDNEYQSIISNDKYSVATNDEEESAMERNEEECLPIERSSDASLADFAFDFQAEWTDDMHIEVDHCDQTLRSGIISPTSVNQF
ncbi:hypothetical protein THRCLA_06007 [Thraustotheca clavata]|uniref:Uncharacterized protein n=1 Tax=Thraustotheca clavata TaxID=74557 RepID=A0A1V9ZQP5_9STRA|nr:hypothetical protein THRCLA_06007 [Thraustotheca clavata]